MELNVLNEQERRWKPPTPCSVVNTTKPWCTRSWLLSRPTLVSALALSSTAATFIIPRKALAPEGYRPCSFGYDQLALWRSGGRAFPNTPDENFSQKLNKKMFRAGMASIYSKLVADARFVVVETIKADLPKTKAFASQLKTLGLTARTLIIVDESELDDNLILASRNLKDVLVVTPRFADPLCLIYFDKVVATKAAVAQIQEMLA